MRDKEGQSYGAMDASEEQIMTRRGRTRQSVKSKGRPGSTKAGVVTTSTTEQIDDIK